MGKPARKSVPAAPLTMTHAEWLAEGERRFGPDKRQWRFKCPCCGHVATTLDWINAGASAEAIAFSCVGRWSGAKREAFSTTRREGPCDYAGGGLFRLNPVRVTDEEGKEHDVFAFADPLPAEAAA